MDFDFEAWFAKRERDFDNLMALMAAVPSPAVTTDGITGPVMASSDTAGCVTESATASFGTTELVTASAGLTAPSATVPVIGEPRTVAPAAPMDTISVVPAACSTDCMAQTIPVFTAAAASDGTFDDEAKGWCDSSKPRPMPWPSWLKTASAPATPTAIVDNSVHAIPCPSGIYLDTEATLPMFPWNPGPAMLPSSAVLYEAWVLPSWDSGQQADASYDQLPCAVRNASYGPGYFATGGHIQITTECSTDQLFLSGSSPIFTLAKFLEWTQEPYAILMYDFELAGTKLLDMLRDKLGKFLPFPGSITVNDMSSTCALVQWKSPQSSLVSWQFLLQYCKAGLESLQGCESFQWTNAWSHQWECSEIATHLNSSSSVRPKSAGQVQHIKLQPKEAEMHQFIAQPGKYMSLCLQPKPPWLSILTKLGTKGEEEGVYPRGEGKTYVQLILFRLLLQRPYSDLPIEFCLHDLQLTRSEMEAGLHSSYESTSRSLLQAPRIPHINQKMELCRAAREWLSLQTQGHDWIYHGSVLLCYLQAILLPAHGADADAIVTWKHYRVQVPWDPGGSWCRWFSPCYDQEPSQGGRDFIAVAAFSDQIHVSHDCYNAFIYTPVASNKTKEVRMPWDPGEVSPSNSAEASAWGQAEFQGGRDVRNLPIPVLGLASWAVTWAWSAADRDCTRYI